MTERELKFEEAMERLDEIVEGLEAEGTSLEESIRLYEEGMKLVKVCEKKLAAAEAKLEKVLPPGVQFDGIFTSPPYVGQIDYHDQHVYAYELFGIPRRDSSEIGPKSGGKSKQAQQSYVADISAVFGHCKNFLKPDGKVFIVANDRFGLYPEIAQRSGLRIKENIVRAVTKRTEQGNDPYQESIFYCVKAD